MKTKTKLITPNQIPQFVNWLRSVAPYIHLFKDKIFVISFSGQLIIEKKLESLIHDLALLNSMGIQIVIVYGSNPQIEEKLRLRKYKNYSLYSMPIWGMKAKNKAKNIIKKFDEIITIEDHFYDGGFGSWVSEVLSSYQSKINIRSESISPDCMYDVGSKNYLLKKYGPK